MFLFPRINRFILKRLLTGGKGFPYHFEDLGLGDFHLNTLLFHFYFVKKKGGGFLIPPPVKLASS